MRSRANCRLRDMSSDNWGWGERVIFWDSILSEIILAQYVA